MKDQKKNNKGFSLVELIVVVAIMAVLLGVLVPTLVRNVEKSKKQKDINNLSEVRNAIQLAMATEDFAGVNGTITLTGTGFSIATDGSINAGGSAVKRILFCKQFFLNKAHGATAENEKSSVLEIFKCLTSRQTFQPVVALELIGVKKCLDFFDNVLPIDRKIARFHGIIDFTLHLRGEVVLGVICVSLDVFRVDDPFMPEHILKQLRL